MEFGMKTSSSFNGGQAPVEWYSGPSSGYGGGGGGGYGTAYAPPPPQHAASAYASFDEEPPLLEGEVATALCFQCTVSFSILCKADTSTAPCALKERMLPPLLLSLQPTTTHDAPAAAELGIDIPAIMTRTRAILLHRMRSPCLDELDFGGALIVLLLLGGLHLLVRGAKRRLLHFCSSGSSSSCQRSNK
jgi:hypothetical protein